MPEEVIYGISPESPGRKAAKRDLSHLVFFVILSVLFFGLPSIIQAESGFHIYVDANNTGYANGSEANPFPTISQAIETASSNDSIHVASGDYYESIFIHQKNINLQGTDPEITIIHGNVTFNYVNGSVLDGFTITESEMYGVLCRDSNSVISRCIIGQNNHHGIGIWGGALKINHCIIWDNGGYGVRKYWGNSTVLNSIIWANQEGGLNGTAADFCIVQGHTWDDPVDCVFSSSMIHFSSTQIRRMIHHMTFISKA